MKKIAVILSIVLMATGLSGCGGNGAGGDENGGGGVTPDLSKVTVVLDWSPNTNHTGLYVAKEKGYYEEAGLDVEIVQPPEDGAVALTASGKAQFGVDFQESLAAAYTADEPMPVTAVAAIINHNTSGLISLKSAGIESFGDLEGKTYAAFQIPLEDAVLGEVMALDGADYSKVNVVPNMAYDAVSALQADVDAIWVYEGWEVMAVKLAGLDYNFIEFKDAEPVFDYFTPVLIANNDYLKDEPEKAKKFLEATAKGYEYAIEHPDESAEILVDAVPELDLALVKLGQEYLAGEYKAESPVWGFIDERRWTNFYDWMYEKGLIDKPLGNFGFTNEYLPQ